MKKGAADLSHHDELKNPISLRLKDIHGHDESSKRTHGDMIYFVLKIVLRTPERVGVRLVPELKSHILTIHGDLIYEALVRKYSYYHDRESGSVEIRNIVTDLLHELRKSGITAQNI